MTAVAGQGGAGARIGIDLGGTKIAGAALAPDDTVLAETRIDSPKNDYAATQAALAQVVAEIERQAGVKGSVGIGMPGSISPVSGLSQGSNSVWLNGKPFHQDIERTLGRPVRLANDANCFALSEAHDGAAAGAKSVFGVIVGTGCGGGLVFRGELVDGPNAIGGEWGHNPLPWPREDEYPGPACWCGRRSCMEVWASGTGLQDDHTRVTGQALSAKEIVARAAEGDADAIATLDRHADRLARGMATMVNIFDPEVIVLGGGLSKLASLYEALPQFVPKYVFAANPRIEVRPPRWGDASGVRGAARLW